MRKPHEYPQINIGSKNELAKRISGPDLSYYKALALINDVLENFDDYWYDSKRSEPEKEKYVRSAVNTPLGDLLKLIDRKILRPHDNLVPAFVFGGLSGRNQIQAAYSLLGSLRQRILLGLDISRFFEQVPEQRLLDLFAKKCGCSARAARLLARLCCVPKGSKDNPSTTSTLARGFATSTRLALWCNLTTFMRVKWTADRMLKGHDPRVAVFVDDIGITASRTTEQKMEVVADAVRDLLEHFDAKQPLPLNPTKKKIRLFAAGVEHLGAKLGKNKLSIGRKAQQKRDDIRNRLQQPLSRSERKKLIKKRKSYYRYEQQIRDARKA